MTTRDGKAINRGLPKKSDFELPLYSHVLPIHRLHHQHRLIYKARLPSMRYNFYGDGNEEEFFFALTF